MHDQDRLKIEKEWKEIRKEVPCTLLFAVASGVCGVAWLFSPSPLATGKGMWACLMSVGLFSWLIVGYGLVYAKLMLLKMKERRAKNQGLGGSIHQPAASVLQQEHRQDIA
jgi:hypothetical protein